MNGTSKVSGAHRSRIALIYVRQSTIAQVRDNTESTARQYGLAEVAAALGWPTDKVVVIDADLGMSGRSAATRSGFREVVTRVCLGEIGAIFGLEMSRLARSSADFSRLLELARLTDTLLIDADGVYDLTDINDRLLLGLKGSMTEVEVHLLKSRLDGAKQAAARRGKLRTRLPIGYLHDDEGNTVLDPDEEVQAAIIDLFAAFTATGSAFKVVEVFAGRRFPYRVHGGPFDGQLRWGVLTHGRVLSMLANPAYAGAYAYGRRPSAQQVAPDGTVRTTVRHLRRPDWPILITDHHPGYMTWERYEQIEQKLAANTTCRGARPAREGSALCQGIIGCGSCGGAMRTRYHHAKRAAPAYYCADSAESRRLRMPTCRTVRAAVVDDAVTTVLLDALTPAEIAVTLAAADEVADRSARACRAAELAVERARYDADRAERAFGACEPENRLVARTLESRWEARLLVLADAQAALAAVHAAMPPALDKATLDALVSDVGALWHAPTTTDRDRKRLLRTLIRDVTILPCSDTALVRIGIRWHTGAGEEIVCTAKRSQPEPAAIEVIRARSYDLTDQGLADLLNATGHTTARGRPFTESSVCWTRQRYNIPASNTPQPGEVTVPQAAAVLGVSDTVVYRWITNGRLSARKTPSGHLRVPWNPATEAECRALIAASPQLTKMASHVASGGAV